MSSWTATLTIATLQVDATVFQVRTFRKNTCPLATADAEEDPIRI